MDFLSNLFGLNESKATSASNASVPNGLAAKLNTPAPQLGGRRRRTVKRRTAKHQRTHKRK